MKIAIGINIVQTNTPKDTGAPPAYTPALQFDDARNSMYLSAGVGA